MLLRYPGGKAKIYKKVRDIVANNNLASRTYVEPFAGGFGLGIKLMLNGDLKKFIINDYDRHIYAFWWSVFNHTNELVDLIACTEITIDEWRNQRKIYDNQENYSLLDVGFSTLFLNRTNFSGILMSGPIGGFNQSGKYKLNCRFNKERLINNIKQISQHRERVEIFNKDSVELTKLLKNRESEIFYNFDPPYVNKGQELYLNAFVEENHRELKEEIDKVNTEWIMTYDNVELIKDLYKEYRQTSLDLNYTVCTKRKEKELLISSKAFI